MQQCTRLLEEERRRNQTPQTPTSIGHFVSAAPDKLMHNLIADDNLNCKPTPQELEESLEGINSDMRWVSVCFLVFPQNVIMKKSLLVRWAGVHTAGDGTPQLIHELITKGLLHPVYKDTLTVGGYWMHPFVHSTLSDRYWLQVSYHRDKVCVTDNSSEDIFYNDPTLFLAKRELCILHLGNWQPYSVRNIEVEDPNSFFKDMAKLSDMTYVSLHGISLVTEMPQFITKHRLLETLDLKSCHNLEVFPSSIGNLASILTHLDMSECYFLKNRPMSLSRLHRLRVLKGFVVRGHIKKNSCILQDLVFLQKLVKLNIYTSVTSFPNREELSALTEFKSLQSLTISWGRCSVPKKETGKSGDIATTDAIIAHKLRQQEIQPSSLRIGRLMRILMGIDTPSAVLSYDTFKPVLFDRLHKLDLQCVPETVTYEWLNPANFRHLQKLYIRGGRFCDLGQEAGELLEEYFTGRERFFDRCQQEEESIGETSIRREDFPNPDQEEYQWSVEILHLKHLENLEMEYMILGCLFPKLI